MADLSPYFIPVSTAPEKFASGLLGTQIDAYTNLFPEWEKAQIVLLACAGSHEIYREDPYLAAEAIRNRLYGLSLPTETCNIADLGNIVIHERTESQLQTLAYILYELLEKGKTVLIIGGSQDTTLGQYQAYKIPIEYVQIDARLDMLTSPASVDPDTYNAFILQQLPYGFCNLGYQRYLVKAEDLSWIESHNYFALRYGLLEESLEQAEPFLRNADMLSVDLSSIRAADMVGASAANPAGFSATEACKLMRYAGMGYKVSSLNLTEYHPTLDPHGSGAMLAAMMLWYFIEGVYNRIIDYPLPDRSNLRQYAVQLNAAVNSINFYRNLVSDRWWMEIPYQEDIGIKHPRTQLVPCSVKDYEQAKQDDIPELWWKIFNKLK